MPQYVAGQRVPREQGDPADPEDTDPDMKMLGPEIASSDLPTPVGGGTWAPFGTGTRTPEAYLPLQVLEAAQAIGWEPVISWVQRQQPREINSSLAGLALKQHVNDTPEEAELARKYSQAPGPIVPYDNYRTKGPGPESRFISDHPGKSCTTAHRGVTHQSWQDQQNPVEAHGDCMCNRREAVERWMIQERGMPVKIRLRLTEAQATQGIPYIARILAAYPTLSQNKRRYGEDVLKSAVRPYVGRPLILDHDYTNTWKVMGTIIGANYGGELSEYTGKYHTGLWLDAVGLMPEELYGKIKGWCPVDGGPCVPPSVRGVSIGGEGEGDPYMGGVDIKQFLPQELSITAFPGIPDAHIASFETIAETINPQRVIAS
jgi:hypothetical protein